MNQPSVDAGTGVPIDPELAVSLQHRPELLHPTSVTLQTLPDHRRTRSGNAPSDKALSRGGRYRVDELTVPASRHLPAVSIVLCRPTFAPAPLPVMFFVHGGAMMLGNRRTGGFEMALDWIEQTSYALCSVEYRLPPEHPHPAPLQDCYTGLCWIYDHADELHLDRTRVVLAGISAGGGLAASTALLNRDQRALPLAGLLLHAPMLDNRCHTPSMMQTGHPALSPTTVATGWAALLNGQLPSDSVPRYAVPGRADDLRGLPPSYIDVGSADPFRDESATFAANLWAAAADAELHVWPGAFHGSEAVAPHAAITQSARMVRDRWLTRFT